MDLCVLNYFPWNKARYNWVHIHSTLSTLFPDWPRIQLSADECWCWLCFGHIGLSPSRLGHTDPWRPGPRSVGCGPPRPVLGGHLLTRTGLVQSLPPELLAPLSSWCFPDRLIYVVPDPLPHPPSVLRLNTAPEKLVWPLLSWDLTLSLGCRLIPVATSNHTWSCRLAFCWLRPRWLTSRPWE